jgi:predicted small lipoprotein YifL
MSSNRRRPRRAAPPAAALGVAVLAAAVALAACGKKGDPEPPLLPIPQAATDLTVEQRGGELILRFAYPRTTAAGLPLPPLERVEVYELVRPAVNPPAPPPPAPAAAATPAASETAEPEAEAGEPEADPASGEPEPDAMDPASGTGERDAGATPAQPEADEAAAAPAEPEAAAAETEAGTTAPNAEPAAGTAQPPTPPSPPADRFVPPPVDPREFAAAATVVRTLRAEELTGAVYGDRLVVTLPLPSPPPDPPQAHLFAVRTAAVGDFVSAFSNQAAIVPRPPPPPPAGLTATPRAEGIEIAWEADAGADEPAGFHVYRRLATERGFGPPLRLAGPAQSSFLDRDARYGQRYIYAVTAVAQRAPLIESAIAAAREVDYRDVFAPPPPAGLVALADEGAIRLVWDESRAPDLGGYRLSRRSGDAAWQPLAPEPVTGVEHTDRDVEPGRTYRYRVTAVDALGNESDPAEAEALAR